MEIDPKSVKVTARSYVVVEIGIELDLLLIDLCLVVDYCDASTVTIETVPVMYVL